MYLLYSVLLSAALLLSLPWWLLEMFRHGKYRAGWRERLGIVPARLTQEAAPHIIWIHAVSVGEVLAITCVVEELKATLPDWRVVVSTTTDTGQRLARERFGESNVFYVPLDLPFTIGPYLHNLRPRMLVLAESEFWPNLLRLARQSGAAVAVINARVSDRSLPGYLRFRDLLRPVMRNVRRYLAQTEEDARRLIQIGAPPDRVQVSGNLKFEVKPPPRPAILAIFHSAIQREQLGPLIVAGSTLEGEEPILLDMFRQVLSPYPNAVLLLAPRHPQRFETVAGMLAASALPFHKRSQWEEAAALAGSVVLLDSIGELASLYELADLTFIGGSLVPRGGHNILEPAQFGKPILVGPHTENFRAMVDVFCNAGALEVVTSESLAPTVLRLLQSDDERTALGARALEIIRSQQGATQRTVAALLELLPATQPAVLDHLSAERRA